MALGYAGGGAELGSITGGNDTSVAMAKDQAYMGLYLGTWAIARDHTVKVAASGTSTVTLTVYVDTVQMTSLEDGTNQDSSSPLGVGHPGFYNANVDEVVDQRFDNRQGY